MKITLTVLVFIALFMVRCADDSSLLTSPESEFTQQSNSPNRVKLSENDGTSVKNQFSVTKNIDIELCKEAL